MRADRVDDFAEDAQGNIYVFTNIPCPSYCKTELRQKSLCDSFQ